MWGLFLGVLIFLAVGLTLLARTLITPERIKARVLPLVEQALTREVTLGEVKIGLFSGIRLADLVIFEKESDEALIRADQAVLRYQFWPLLQGRVVIDEVRLENPRIALIRLSDGSFNISDWLQTADDPDAAVEPSPSPVSVDSEKEQGIDMLISRLVVDGGELYFVDYQINAQAPYRYQIDNLNVEARDISPEREFPFIIKARLNGAEFSVDGKAHPKNRVGQAAIQLDNLDLTAFLPYFREHLPGHLGSLKLDLKLSVVAGTESLAGSGNLALRDIDVNLNALPKTPIAQARLAVDYDLLYETSAGRLAVNRMRVDFNGIPLDLQGELTGLDKTPQADLQLSLTDLELRSALNALPVGLVSSLQAFDPAGFVTARVDLAGPVDNPRALLKKGDFQLTNLQGAAAGLRPVLNGRLQLEGKGLKAEKLRLAIGEDSAFIDLRIPDIFADPIEITSSMAADRFRVDPLLERKKPAVAGGNKASTPGSPPAEVSQEIGPFDLPIKAAGEIRIKQAVYQAMLIDNLLLRYRLEKNLLTVETLSGQVAGGAFKQSGTVDLSRKGLAYEGRVELTSLALDTLTRLFAPRAQGTVLGALSLATEFKGRGTRAVNLREQLTAEGDFSFMDGRLKSSPLTQGFAELLRLDELKELSFKNGSGNYRIRQGRLQLNGSMSGQDLSLAPTGEIGLDGGLDLDLAARLSPKLSAKLDKKGRIVGYFSDEQGWTRIPLKLGGTLERPHFVFDSSALKEQAGDDLRQKLEEKVMRKLDPSGTSGEKIEPAKQLMKDALQGLFGR
jgi:AsmA protein